MLFLAISALFSLAVHSSTVCDESYECSSETISDSYIYCEGYYGCYNANITVEDGAVDCGGYFGCSTGSIYAVESEVSCTGYLGCYLTHVYNPYESTYCFGDWGCGESVIRSNQVLLNGYFSGYDSVIYGHATSSSQSAYSYVYAYGYYGAAYASMSSSSASNFYVYLFGYMSGYYLDVECMSGATCHVYCSENSCYHTRLFCYEGSTCEVTCDAEAEYCVSEYTFSAYTDEELKAVKMLPDTNRETSRVQLLEKQRKSHNNEEFEQLFLSKDEKSLFKKKKLAQIGHKKSSLTMGSFSFWMLIGVILAVAAVAAVASLWFCMAGLKQDKYQSLRTPVQLMSYT